MAGLFNPDYPTPQQSGANFGVQEVADRMKAIYAARAIQQAAQQREQARAAAAAMGNVPAMENPGERNPLTNEIASTAPAWKNPSFVPPAVPGTSAGVNPNAMNFQTPGNMVSSPPPQQ